MLLVSFSSSGCRTTDQKAAPTGKRGPAFQSGFHQPLFNFVNCQMRFPSSVRDINCGDLETAGRRSCNCGHHGETCSRLSRTISSSSGSWRIKDQQHLEGSTYSDALLRAGQHNLRNFRGGTNSMFLCMQRQRWQEVGERHHQRDQPSRDNY